MLDDKTIVVYTHVQVSTRFNINKHQALWYLCYNTNDYMHTDMTTD